jgi:hypothetical protein
MITETHGSDLLIIALEQTDNGSEMQTSFNTIVPNAREQGHVTTRSNSTSWTAFKMEKMIWLLFKRDAERRLNSPSNRVSHCYDLINAMSLVNKQSLSVDHFRLKLQIIRLKNESAEPVHRCS